MEEGWLVNCNPAPCVADPSMTSPHVGVDQRERCFWLSSLGGVGTHNLLQTMAALNRELQQYDKEIHKFLHFVVVMDKNKEPKC